LARQSSNKSHQPVSIETTTGANRTIISTDKQKDKQVDERINIKRKRTNSSSNEYRKTKKLKYQQADKEQE
jgi:hypothetical protein